MCSAAGPVEPGSATWLPAQLLPVEPDPTTCRSVTRRCAVRSRHSGWHSFQPARCSALLRPDDSIRTHDHLIGSTNDHVELNRYVGTIHSDDGPANPTT